MKIELRLLAKKSVITLFVLIVSSVLTVFLYFFIQQYRKGVLLEKTPETILKKMTLEEKVGQIIHVGIKGKNLNSLAIRDIQKLHVGGIILFAANLGDKESIKKLNGDLQSLSISSSGIPLFISIDQEGGRVARIPNDSSPGALAMGQTGNPIYAEDVGFVTAYNLKKLGFNMNLAPVLDVNSNPDNPVINTRSFGSDPELVASMGISHAKGIREALVVPVVKHFPGHGDTNTDSHLALPKINKSLEDLEKMELLPFRRSIEKGAEAVMSAHILFPALDGEAPATLSPAILKGILRNKYKYDGLIFTDAMEMHAISKRYKPEESAKKAFLAGVDIILLTTTGSDTERIYNALLSAFKSGELIESDLDRSVLRQISLKFRNGYFHSLDSRYANHELKKYFSEKSEGVERKFSRIAKRYNNRTLYETVAMDGIRSLRREYTIPDFKEKKNLKFYYSTLSMKSFALSRGIPEENIMPFGIPSVISVLRSNKANYHCIVEINEFNLRAWNQIVLQIAEHSNPEQKNIPTLVGLYTGNPFLDIKIPATGAVLASFSPTEESLKALLDTYLEKKVVRKANLILHVER